MHETISSLSRRGWLRPLFLFFIGTELKLTALALVSAVALLLVASPALAAFIFRSGDSVWVDGKRYTWEEWKKIRDDPEFIKKSQEAEAAKPAAPAIGPRAAACTTAIYYDE